MNKRSNFQDQYLYKGVIMDPDIKDILLHDWHVRFAVILWRSF